MVEYQSRAMIAADDTVSVLCADLRDPAAILGSDQVRDLIDPRQTDRDHDDGGLDVRVRHVGSMGACVAVRARGAGGRLPVAHHLTDDSKPPVAVEGFRAVFDNATERMHFRSKAQVERFFAGLEMVPPYPGAAAQVNFAGLWGAEDPDMADSEGSRWMYSGVARIR